jgi:hypothetical protein
MNNNNKVCTLFPPPVDQIVWPSEKSPRCKDLKTPQVSHYYLYFESLLWEWYLINICQKKQRMISYSPLLLYIQTGSGAHPASYSTSTKVLFWVCSSRGVTLITRHHLPPGLRTFAPPKCFHGINRDILHISSPWMCRNLFIQTNSEISKIKIRRICNRTYTKLTVNTFYSPHSSV